MSRSWFERGVAAGRGRPGPVVLALLFLWLTAVSGVHLYTTKTAPAAHAAPDAALAYSSYLGGDGADEIRGITLDSAGNIYVIGETESDNLLGSGWNVLGFSDIFVAKFSPDGRSLRYLTFIGSPDTDTPKAIGVDAQGNVYATAQVYNDNFPVKNALWTARPHYSHNSVLFKLNGSGGLVYSTYLPLDVFDARQNLAVDAAGNAYVTGASFQGAWANQLSLLKISPGGGQLLLQRHIGGPDSEKGTAVALDPAGNIYLAGTTEGGDAFPVTPNAHQPTCGDILYNRRFYCYKDGVVVVLNPAGQVAYSSHHGGSFTDDPAAIAADGQGNVFVAGNTGSGLFPLANPLQNSCPLDTFTGDCSAPRGFASLIRLNAGRATLIYSTYLGSTESGSTSVVTAAAMDGSGQATVVGYSNGRFFPKANPIQAQLFESFCTTFGSQRLCFDAFALTFTPTGSLFFGSYLGAAFDDYAYGVAMQGGAAFVAGLTEANNFPVTGDAFQKANQAGDDGFVVKISGGIQLPLGKHKVYLPLVIR